MTKPLVHRNDALHDSIHDAASYDYALPPESIAQAPLARRDASRLLVVDRKSGDITASQVTDLPALLDPGDLLVFNDTRVIKARIDARRADTQGQIEVLVVRVDDGSATALLRTRGRLAPGVLVRPEAPGEPALELVLREDLGGGEWRLETGVTAAALLRWLEQRGRVPLPPYIRRERGADARDPVDEDRYQTVLAKEPGAVAAPTAGLHFSRELLASLDARGIARTCVTLHVGPGTFRPVTTTDIREHVMHAERFEVAEPCAALVRGSRERGLRVVAVGTTSVRALESASTSGSIAPTSGSTNLFIYPPYAFRSVDALVTNFHAPRSTLLMMTSAFAGRELLLRAYEHAIALGFRMLSYGDAMLIL